MNLFSVHRDLIASNVSKIKRVVYDKLISDGGWAGRSFKGEFARSVLSQELSSCLAGHARLSESYVDHIEIEYAGFGCYRPVERVESERYLVLCLSNSDENQAWHITHHGETLNTSLVLVAGDGVVLDRGEAFSRPTIHKDFTTLSLYMGFSSSPASVSEPEYTYFGSENQIEQGLHINKVARPKD